MPASKIEGKVSEYLRKSQLLQDRSVSLTSGQLQAEMERMARHSKNSDMLRELFDALGDDAFVIAECLAKPALTERLLNEFQGLDANSDGEAKHEETPVQAMSGPEETGATTDGPMLVGYALPPLTSTTDPCTDDTWSSIVNVPGRRANHSAVWTGSEMIVWGGLNYNETLGTGDRYDPATDTWSKVSLTGAPIARFKHTAVWTGTEMIVWGGKNVYNGYTINSGGKYDPANDSWAPTSLIAAPSPRIDQTALWTGSEMIIWGGVDSNGWTNTGARYNPSLDLWTTTTTLNAPVGRNQQSAVWTGHQMIVWGGENYYGNLNNGASYDPGLDSWTAICVANAPTARYAHSAVWTGSEMVIWGGWNGSALNDGARYNPTADTWNALSASNPPEGRCWNSYVWTGSEMIVWGGIGYGHHPTSGARYNPVTNIWTPMTTANVPGARDSQTTTTIWTGSEMIVFGGGYGETFNTGSRYNPTTDIWTPVSTNNTPEGRSGHTAVWTGSEMIVWGGYVNSTWETDSGGRYDPALDTWTPTSEVNTPDLREAHTAIWTGTEMIVWGGWWHDPNTNHFLNSGGRYDPATDSWTATSLTNAPDPRRYHSVVWTGTEMIVFGGETFVPYVGYSPANTGGRYNPRTDTWTSTNLSNAPSPRLDHTAVWSGREMIVFGGGPHLPSNTGAKYDPLTDSWVSTSTNTDQRSAHSAVWTGNEMIVWGGYNGSIHVNTGARYNPGTDTWSTTNLFKAADGRVAHAAIWTGNEMIVWGGYSYQQNRFFNTGGRYNPANDSWTSTSLLNVAHVAEFPTAVWTGSRMLVWGGFFAFSDPALHDHQYALATGGGYCVAAPSVTPTPTVTPSPTSTPSPTPTPSATPTSTPTPTPSSGPAVMTDPAPGSTFTSSNVTFTWSAGSATSYALLVGKSQGASDIYNSGITQSLSKTVSNIPIDGRAIYVTLASLVNNSWSTTRYTYAAANLSPTPTPTPTATPSVTPTPAPSQGVSMPIISPAGGTFRKSVTVKMSCATSGAAIHYTMDGSDPTISSAAYSTSKKFKGIKLTGKGSHTVKAIGTENGFADSSITSATFTIN